MSKIRINGYEALDVIVHETGEKICEVDGKNTTVDDGILTGSQLKKKMYIDNHIINFNKGENFVKLFNETRKVMAKKLTPKQFVVALDLTEFIDYQTCILCNGYGKGRHVMDFDELVKELDMDKSNLRKILNALISRGVICKFSTGNVNTNIKSDFYLYNPYICCNGKDLDKDVYTYFQNTGWKELLYK